MKRKWTRRVLGLLVLCLLIGGPIAYAQYRAMHIRNFRVVQDGKVYRSGQMSVDSLQRIIKEYQIKTVLSLRYPDAPGSKAPDWQEEEFCLANGIRYERIRPLSYHLDDDWSFPADKPVAEFLKLMDDPSAYPVLIHCFAGKHRTGAFCGIYRMEYQGWNSSETKEEMMANGYVTLDEEKDIQAYITNYVPRSKRPANPPAAPLVVPGDAGTMKK